MTLPNTDCGLTVVEHYFSLLEIDADACLREPRGFTWWAGDLAQRVWSDPPVVRDGTVSWKIHARTDLLAGFVAGGENFGLLNEIAGFPSLGGGLIREAGHGDRIQLASCLNTTEASFEWAKSFFPSTAATQTAEAHQLACIAPALTGCAAAYSAHPAGGRAERHAAVLDLFGAYVRAGRKPLVWVPEDFDEAADELDVESYPVFTSESGLTAHVPFRNSTALGEMTTSAAHPSYGNGLQMRLVLPFTLSGTADPEIVLRCNRLEIESLAGVGHFTGSYYPDDDGFSYRNFIPNLESYRRVPFLISLIRLFALRARWLEKTEAAMGQER